MASNSLEIKRKEIQRLMDNGLFPYTKRYLGTLRNHFSTLGVNGVNEMIRNFSGDEHDITSEWGHAFAVRLLDHIRAPHRSRSRKKPATCTTWKPRRPKAPPTASPRKTASAIPDILQAGTEDAPYYTNSSQLPVGFTDDAFEALERQDELQRKYTGGTVLHLYMSERISQRRGLQESGAPRAGRASACPTSPSRRLFPFAPSTATWPASTSSAPSATRKPCPANVLLPPNPRRLI